MWPVVLGNLPQGPRRGSAHGWVFVNNHHQQLVHGMDASIVNGNREVVNYICRDASIAHMHAVTYGLNKPRSDPLLLD
jgi:hypothetical protein